MGMIDTIIFQKSSGDQKKLWHGAACHWSLKVQTYVE